MRRKFPKHAKPSLCALVALVAAVAFALVRTSPAPEATRPANDAQAQQVVAAPRDAAQTSHDTGQTAQAAPAAESISLAPAAAGARIASVLAGRSGEKAEGAAAATSGRDGQTRGDAAREGASRAETTGDAATRVEIARAESEHGEPGRVETGRGADASAESESEREREEAEEERKAEQKRNARPDRPDEAVRWRSLQLVDENGHIPHNALMDAWEQARRIPVDPIAWPHAAQDEPPPGADAPEGEPVAGINPGGWTWLGPGNIGGRIRSVVIHPTDPLAMWVGSVGGGIWRTTNAGTSWTPVNDFMANLAVSSMVIDTTNPAVLYAGTGEGFFNSDALRGAGVFKSVDGGTTWAQLPQTNTPSWYAVNRLALSPANSQIILAATGSGIWRSTDGGATWTQRTTAGAMDINFHPTDGSRAIASGSSGLGARFSADGGVTWSPAAGLPSLPGFLDRVEVAYARSNPQIVYASVNTGGGQVFRSADGGQSYTLAHTGSNYLGGQGWYDNALWVDPTNPDVVIVGGIDLWRSTNGGVNFTRISQWQSAPLSAHADHHIIVESPLYGTGVPANRTVYFGNDGGIYRALDVTTVTPTVGWQELNNNLGITQFYGGAGNATSGRVLGGTQDNGTLRFTGNTETWNAPFGGDGGWCAADPTDPNYFYGEYVFLQIHRSSNGGQSSQFIYNGIADAQNSRANFIAPFILDPNNPNTLLAGGDQLWRSTNVKATTPTWASIKPSAGSNISAVAAATGNSNVVWIGHNNGDVYFTVNGTDAAPTWTRADLGTPGLPNRFVTRVTIDPTNHGRVYVTFGGFNTGNVWRTDNSGATWTNVSANLPAAPVRSLVVWQPNPNQLYVGTEVGVFASADGGQSWSPSNDGPTNCSVDELFWMNNTLVAVTHGRGMFSIAVGSSGLAPTAALTSPLNGASFTAPATVALAATAADADGTITRVDFFANGALVGTDTAAPYEATWSNVAGGAYNVTARATDNSGNTGTSAAANITVAGGPVGPPNNNFANAQAIGGATGSVAGTNVGANKETGEPNHGSRSGGASVWYNWQAPATAAVTFRTAGSSFDTVLGVYTGTSVGALTEIAGNDDTSDLSSLVTFTAAAGTTYRIAVDGFGGQTGQIVLAWTQSAPCTYSISPTSLSASAAGGPGSVGVTTQAGCAWTAVSNASFISVAPGAGGTGSGTLAFSVVSNVGAQRTGTITVAGLLFTVTQAAGTPPNASVQFSAAAFSAGEGATSAFATVTRTGSTTGPASVVYSTVDDPAAVRCDVAGGTAYARCDYATTIDTLQFAPGQTQLTFAVPLVNDAHVEGPELLTLRLSAATGATLGAQSTAVLTILDNDAAVGPNPINTHPFFVRQHYLDFLSREPDAGGLAAWLGVLDNCPDAFNTSSDTSLPSARCDRILVSSSFFRSPEFQLKGLYTYLFYKVSFGRLPEYAEITPDMRSVTGATQAEVFQKRAAFADNWVLRAPFRSAYDAMSSTQFVDALLGRYQLAQVTTPDPANPEGGVRIVLTRADLINRLNAGTLTRARVVRAVVESTEVDAREFNGAFVAMQYYGYLRRTPEPGGYQSWLNYLNANPNDSRTMVNGFLNSGEYRLRFGQP